MTKLMTVGVAVMVAVGVAVAADYTPAAKEAPVKVQTAQTVTNGQAVTVSQGLNVLTPAGSADGATNTVTLAAPAYAGLRAVIVVGSGATNALGIADSGTAALSAAFGGSANDTLELIAASTSTWVQVGKSDN